jgi:DNA-binding SARP family transcriptional activator
VSSVEFRILGSLEVERGGIPVALGGTHQRSLLVLLLLHANEPMSADRLVLELWGEPTPARGSSGCRWRLRRCAGRLT